jgi:hypothetical protein
MAETSNQTTGNVPVEGTDPGGTRPAPKGDALHVGKSGLTQARPAVESGDRNVMGKEPDKGPGEG